MPNLPGWAWSGIICLLLGALGGGTLVIQLKNPNNSVTVIPNPITPSSENNLEDLVIIVKDSKTEQPLVDVEISITYEKGLIPGRTLDDGTYRFQVPQQKLGGVVISLIKQGYKKKDIPKDFSVNPNEPLTIYLEPEPTENTNPPTNSTSSDFLPKNENGFFFQVTDCEKKSDELFICNFKVTNLQEKSRELALRINNSRLIDSEGTEILASEVRLGSNSSAFYTTNIFPSKVPINGGISFNGIPSGKILELDFNFEAENPLYIEIKSSQ